MNYQKIITKPLIYTEKVGLDSGGGVTRFFLFFFYISRIDGGGGDAVLICMYCT